MPEGKDWLLAKSKQLLNYMILKIGLFAIASVWGLADFANATTPLRIVYVLCFLGLILYIYLYYDTRKYLLEIDKMVKSQQ